MNADDQALPGEAASSLHTTSATSGGLFVRNATGLVRDLSPRSTFWMQLLGAHPTQPLAYGLFFAFALFPGANFVIGGLLAIPLVLVYAYSFGLLTSMMPRTGGDYLFVTRIISPSVGMISSFCQLVALLMSLAYFGIGIVTLGLAPGFTGIGLIAHNSTLVSMGTDISDNKWWIFLIGTVLYVLAISMFVGGWRFTIRAQNAILALCTLGLVTCGLVALFISKGTFISDFNKFARPYTHLSNSYAATLANATKAGVNLNPSFSFAHTIPVIGIMGFFAIYTWFAAYAGSELRRGRSTRPAHMMAFSGTVALLLVILFAWIFIHSWGNSFMIAANSSSGLPKGITATPTYFFLAAASVGNTAFAIFVVVTYLLFWIGVTYYVFLPVTRAVFAYAFDGLLPKSITKVNDRTHIPLGAMLLAFGLTEIFFIWALRIGNFIEVLTYATLIQLISMGLVGLTAAIVPWRKPMLYKAGATQTRVLGVPVVTIAGGGAVLASVLLWLLYFHWPSQFGLSNYGQFFTYVFGTMVAGVAFFWIITLVKRRRGFDQRLVYKEIPPE